MTLEARYRRALMTFVDGESREIGLMAAFDLGRTALGEGHGLLDLLEIHHKLAFALAEQPLPPGDLRQRLTAAQEFLAQVAAPFEMAHLAWHKMADRLRLANEELEKRVAARTKAHREAAERLDHAQQIAAIGSWEIDFVTGLQVWSKQMYRICGLPVDHDVPSSIIDFVHEQDRERQEGWFAQLAAGREPGSIEFRVKRPNGELRVVSADGEAIAAENGTISKLTCTLQDITERKATEAQLHELRAELTHISRLNTMSHMTSALAHELIQPLSATNNYLRGARRLLEGRSDDVSSKVRDALENAGNQTVRASEIIGRLRDFMSRREIEFRLESVRRLVEEIVALALVGVRDRGVHVEFSFDPRADLVLIDRIQIQQVLVNLLRNAIEAMQASEHRRLSISAEPTGDTMVLISVADTGPGVAEDVAARLFQPFVTSKQHGMGVGLSICRTIIESHGGRIWFERNPGGGTIFRLTLRAAAPDIMDTGSARPTG